MTKLVDNQSTMRRELWQNGKIVAWMSAILICEIKDDNSDVKMSHLSDVEANIARFSWGFWT